MTKTKSTKRALLTSGLVLIMCITMLIGTTFAWFTDSVTSAGNIIKSGTLDVEMYWAEGTEAPDTAAWKDASTGTIFNYDLWEPGYTEVRHIKIENKGSLALKYQINIIANGEVSKLADVIDVYYVDPAVQVANRTDLAAAPKLGTLTEVLDAINTSASGNLLAGENDTITLALKMQETAGNEYQGLAIGSDFSVQLLATQLTYEEDSFDNQYDKDAVYADTYVSSAADLANAFANAEDGDIIALMDDMDVAQLSVAADKNVVLNLNGNTVSGTSANDSGNQWAFQVKGNLTVEGPGKIVMKHTGANMGWGALTAAFTVEGGTLTLGKDVTVVHSGGSDMAYAVDVNSTLGETVLNVNGAVLNSSYVGVRLFNNHKTQKAIVNFNDGAIDGPRRDIWKQYDKPAEINIADGIAYSNANEYEYFFGTEVAVSANELKDALASGADEIIANGVVVEGSTQLNTGATVIGATFKNENGIAVTQTISGTFKDCVFEGSEALRWCYSNAGETVVFENCEIKTTLRGVHFDDMKGDVVFKNCKINGFNAIGGDGTVTFEKCTFGNDRSRYNGLNMYSNINLIDCTFNFESGKTNFIDMEGTGKTLTITNCKAFLDGTATDIRNFVGGSKLAQNTVVYN